MADIITRLKVESGEYDNKLRRAASELSRMGSDAQKTGQRLSVVDKGNVALARSLGSMSTVARSAKGKIGELNGAFVEASLVYRRLSDEEKRSPFGRALAKSLDELKVRAREAKVEMSSVQKELGDVKVDGLLDMKGLLGDLAGELGVNSRLIGVLSGGAVGLGAAMGGAAMAVGAAAKAWGEYNAELSRQDNMTMVTTGVKGDDVGKLTDGVRSLSSVYGVEFRDALNGANLLMQQFGVSGKDALDLLNKGLSGMVQGDGGKLLQMVQSYGPAFRDAGLGASELLAVINNTEGGLFTDEMMGSIMMGVKNIRLMKDSTKKALMEIGVDADDMLKRMNDGSLSVFGALRMVSDAVMGVGSGSQAAGEVMQSVFGRQGASAGQMVGKAISELNLDLDETMKQTAGVGSRLRDLEKADVELQGSLRELFSLSGAGWDEMAAELEGKVVVAMNGVLGCVIELRDAFDRLPDVVKDAAGVIGREMGKQLPVIGGVVDGLSSVVGLMRAIGGGDGLDGYGSVVGGGLSGSFIPGVSGKKDDGSAKYGRGSGSGNVGGNGSGNGRGKGSVSNGGSSNGGSSKGGSRGSGLDDAIGKSLREMNRLMSDEEVLKLRVFPVIEGEDGSLLEKLSENGENRLVVAEEMTGLSGQLEDVFTAFDFELEEWRKKFEGDGKDQKKKKGIDYGDGSAIDFAKDLVGGLSGISSGLEGLGVDMSGGFGEVIQKFGALMTVVSSIETIVGAIEAIDTIGSLLPFAGGGVVPAYAARGKAMVHGTDSVPAMLTPGELVLNRAETGNLASQLNDVGGLSGLKLETYVREDKLWLVLNNGLKKRGMGRLLTR